MENLIQQWMFDLHVKWFLAPLMKLSTTWVMNDYRYDLLALSSKVTQLVLKWIESLKGVLGEWSF